MERQIHPAGEKSVLRRLTQGLILVMAATVMAGAPPEVPGEPEALPKWESTAGVSLTLSAGNAENILFSADLGTQRKWEQNELQFGVTGGYGKSRVDVTDPVTGQVSRRTDKNTEFIRGFGQYNRLFSERVYGYARADALHDDIANVEYRVSVSPGVGYYFVKEPRTTLRGEIGPGYVFERTYNEVARTYENNDYLSLRLSNRFEHRLSERARLWQSGELVPEVGDFSNYILNLEVGIEADITESLSLRAVAQDTYDNEPPPGREHNDFRLLAGLSYRF
jgi:putative salt-induced outer membrane protein YdiY